MCTFEIRVRSLAALLLLGTLAGCRRPAPEVTVSRKPPPAETGAPPAPAASPGSSPAATAASLPDFSVDAVSTQLGEATWYEVPAGSLAQRRAWTAEMTAASDRIPPNTYVRVRRLENGRSVVVRITDHGIHQKGTIIDLDRPAAEALGMLKAGRVQVQVAVLALKHAETTGPPASTAKSGGSEVSLPKPPGASAADEKGAAERKAGSAATP